jgi:hypothetical protein
MRLSPLRFLMWSGLAAVAGFAIFGVMVWRAVDVVDAAPADATAQFEEVRTRFGSQPPLLAFDDQGRLVRGETTAPTAPAPIGHLRVLSYRAATGRLARARVAIWFLKLKGPAAQLVLRDTGLDLAALRLTAADLERAGPAIVLDRRSDSGDRLLVWTE